MTKILSCGAVLGLLVASSSAFAGGHGGLGGGASSISPGDKFRDNGPPTSGPTAGFPGASGYAPGRLFNEGARPTISGPGASGFAPGRIK